MSEKLQMIFARRSIRAYVEGEVKAEDLDLILKAAMSAPSAINNRPWHFTVIREPEVLKQLADSAGRHRASLHTAPLALLVSGDTTRFMSGAGAGFADSWQQDCSAATQNVLLAATALGYGSLWMGVYPSKEGSNQMREVLGLPEHLIPFSLIAIGHPGEQKEPRNQYEANQITWM